MHALWTDCHFALISPVRQVQMNFLVDASGSRTHWTNIREAPYEALSVLTSPKAGPAPSRPVRKSIHVWASKRKAYIWFQCALLFPCKSRWEFRGRGPTVRAWSWSTWGRAGPPDAHRRTVFSATRWCFQLHLFTEGCQMVNVWTNTCTFALKAVVTLFQSSVWLFC